MRFVTVRLKTVLMAVLIGSALLLGSGFAYATEAAQVWQSGARSLPVYSVERTDNKIAISFDCAWGTEHTDAILSALAEAGVRATFFTVQFWAEEHADYLKKVSDAGHEVGTHSATHSYMSRQSEAEIRAELESSSQAITAVTGKPVTLFRPPYGDYDDLLIDTCRDMGIMPVQWDVDSLDWKDLSAADIAERIISRVKSGSIILCHNNGLHTAEALPIVIDALHAKGFTFVPIGELIYYENYTIDVTGRQHLQTAQ
ncbi:MAG TPA: polysaccharide deacetylase family protein [Firmicutes bacterium]|nr:polysaccharide deacetylase family protein [Bacillota bacterium]